MPIPRRRAALTTLVLVLAPWSLFRVLGGLIPLPGVDPARVVNGMFVPPAGVVGALVEPVVWAWAVTAAIAATAPVDRPLRRAFRALPTVGAALLAGAGTLLVALLLLGTVLPAGGGLVWVVAALVALPVAALLVRFALVLPIAVLDGLRGRAAFRASFVGIRGNALGLGVALLFGVAAPALLYGWAFARPEEKVTDPLLGVLAWLLRDATLIAVVALQAQILLVAHRNLPGRSLLPALDLDQAPPAVDRLTRRLGRLTVPLGLAAVLLPAGLVGGVVAAERLPEVTVNTADLPHKMIAVAWPVGRGPILVGQRWFEDCLDETCRTRHRTKLSVTMYEPYGGAAFGADGSVYALGQYALEQCDAQRICRGGKDGLAVLRESQAAAITISPTGEILLASATEVRPADPAPDEVRPAAPAPDDARPVVELKLIRCPDVFCATPRVTSLGRVNGSLRDRGGSQPTRLVVRVDASGRPVVALRSPSAGGVSVGWCATLDCARPEVAPIEGPRRPGMPTPEEVALLDVGDVLDCRLGHGCDGSEPLATVHRPRGGVWDVVAEPAHPDGLYLRLGSGPWPDRAVLRVCTDRACREAREVPLVEIPPVQTWWSDRPARERWLMAVDADGRVVATDPYGLHVVVVTRP
ncbi:hypothetical protein FXF50_07815 [Micromonospora sp. AP08]|uniref:hypothetical protein n=1 Tax=Micromonospora sp. AP08 TaxID=2604467 RepID=UPI0011D37FB5|nr:hypothetical protein [Micromonospora sp. AP08]TYB39146.1 hypothetical protein FXF50_07815 [Micromonospora sp. AP08]